GYNLNKRLLEEGFYINLGIFPAVPVKNTGLRFTITNHISKKEIKHFVDALEHHYPLALKEEGKSNNDVRKAFRLPLLNENESNRTNSSDLKIFIFRNIQEINEHEWDQCFSGKGNFDWNGLKALENAFTFNEKEEENWNFYYLIIRDEKNEIILASYFTSGLFKDDLFEVPSVSFEIEKKRKEDPKFLTSKLLMMGSLFSEGEHLFVNRKHPLWKKAIEHLVHFTLKIERNDNLNGTILRDFHKNDSEISDLFHELGFFKSQLPNTNILSNLPESIDMFYSTLSGKKRKHIRDEVFKFISDLDISFHENLSQNEIDIAYRLYETVANRNFSINMFKYPKTIFSSISKSNDWEFIIIKIKKEYAAIGCCYKSGSNYFPLLLGLSDQFNKDFKIYKQVLFQVVNRAIELKVKTIYFGISADLEKKKLGAESIEKVAYSNIKDNFNATIIQNISMIA
ncbi:MAG: hypothetical protein KDK36_04635, partial [Leptospiraceae bacterium]|nr:hypothetical protein [Leptospiraceae bacterium]